MTAPAASVCPVSGRSAPPAYATEKARAATGLDNFGDPGFREGLERLVDSADREARLNDAGRAMFDGQTIMMLMTRLEIEDWYTRHPEIDEQEIVAPLFVVEVRAGPEVNARGTGHSKRAAQQSAAHAALQMLNVEEGYEEPEEEAEDLD